MVIPDIAWPTHPPERFCYADDNTILWVFSRFVKQLERQWSVALFPHILLPSWGWVNWKGGTIQKVPWWAEKEHSLPEVIRLLNENPSARDGLPPCEGQGNLRKPIEAVATTHGCVVELDSKTLLLKTPHTLTLDIDKLNWDLTGNFHPVVFYSGGRGHSRLWMKSSHQQSCSAMEPVGLSTNRLGRTCLLVYCGQDQQRSNWM